MLSLILLLPTLLFAQQDSTKPSFRIGKCRIEVAGKTNDQDTVTIAELLKDPEVKLQGCFGQKLLSYQLSTASSGLTAFWCENPSDSLQPRFTNNMIRNLQILNDESLVIIQNIKCISNDKTIDTLPNLTLKISELTGSSIKTRPKKYAAIGMITKSGTLSYRALKGINKLTIQGGSSSDIITHFQLGADGYDPSPDIEISDNASFTSKMKDLMQKTPEGGHIYIENVHILSNGENHLIPGIIITINNPE